MTEPTRIRVTVTACPEHPDIEPTMPAATCSSCGQQLEVTTTVVPDQDTDR